MEKKESRSEENKENIESKIKPSYNDEEALDIQINYLKSSFKNILYSFITNEQDFEEKKDIKIDKGIYIFLKNIYSKYYSNEIKYILGTINNNISFINEKNKKQNQYKQNIERDLNAISQEKIEYFDKKETLDKELEILTLNSGQNSIIIDTPNNNLSELGGLDEKLKKKELLVKKYNKLNEQISSSKIDYPKIKEKNNTIQGENMLLNEKLKQKQLIWDQIRKENERIKTVVIKRQYFPVDDEKKVDKNKEKENKNIKVSKIGSFLKNMLGKK